MNGFPVFSPVTKKRSVTWLAWGFQDVGFWICIQTREISYGEDLAAIAGDPVSHLDLIEVIWISSSNRTLILNDPPDTPT